MIKDAKNGGVMEPPQMFDCCFWFVKRYFLFWELLLYHPFLILLLSSLSLPCVGIFLFLLLLLLFLCCNVLCSSFHPCHHFIVVIVDFHTIAHNHKFLLLLLSFLSCNVLCLLFCSCHFVAVVLVQG